VSGLTPEERRQAEAGLANLNRRIASRRGPSSLAELLPRAQASIAGAQKRHDVRNASWKVLRGGKAKLEERKAQAKALVANLPRRLGGFVSLHAAARRRKSKRAFADVARAVARLLEAEAPTTGHQAAVMGRPLSYVQESDLDELVPDGWAKSFPHELWSIGKRAGIAPRAVALCCLLAWVSQLRQRSPDDPKDCGCGFQVSLEWLARKLGCSVSWVANLLLQLDPWKAWHYECAARRRENVRRRDNDEELLPMPPEPAGGTVFARRHQRFELYADMAKRDGSSDIVWLDRRLVPHQYVQVRGVAYLTDAGLKLFGGRVKGGLSDCGPLDDVRRRAMRARRLLQRRLGVGTFDDAGLPGVDELRPPDPKVPLSKKRLRRLPAPAG
jgi:hypothetical protein